MTEAVVALLGEQLHDTQHGAMGHPELEEAVDDALSGGYRSRALPVVAVDVVGETTTLVGELLGDGEHDGAQVVEVLVEGRGRGAGITSDVRDRQIAVGRGDQQGVRAVDETLAGGLAAAAGDAPIGGESHGRLGFGHRAILPIG